MEDTKNHNSKNAHIATTQFKKYVPIFFTIKNNHTQQFDS